MTRLLTSLRTLYESLVQEHSAGLYRLAYRLCGEAETAEDLVQESYCEAWSSIASLRDPSRARPWLFQILRHRYAHWIRRMGRRLRPTPLGNHEPVDGDDCDPIASFVDRNAIEIALQSLDDRYREPLLLVVMEGFSCAEAAETLGIPRGTVLSRLHRARRDLRRNIAATASEEIR